MLTGIDILGVEVWSGPVDEVIKHIDDRLDNGVTTRVAFLNSNLSNLLSRQAELNERMQEFLVLNDGLGMDIARRILHGNRFVENLNGTDFTSAFLDRTRHQLRIFLLGARPEVIGQTACAISRRWPRHKVTGYHHGFLRPGGGAELTSMIVQARPDIILVGMGNPRQEQWIASNVPEVCTCGIAVGAWFDFITGIVPRAPRWMRAARLEWVFRLIIEPRRLAGRYLIGNLVFLFRVALTRLRLDGS